MLVTAANRASRAFAFSAADDLFCGLAARVNCAGGAAREPLPDAVLPFSVDAFLGNDPLFGAAFPGGRGTNGLNPGPFFGPVGAENGFT